MRPLCPQPRRAFVPFAEPLHWAEILELPTLFEKKDGVTHVAEIDEDLYKIICILYDLH